MAGSVRSTVLAATLCTAFASEVAAQDLVAPDRVGSTDAPNVLTVRVNANQSPNSPQPAQKEAFAEVWQTFAEAHPDWRLEFEFFGSDIGSEHARLLELARAGRAPDCVAVDSFQLALFIENEVLQPLDDFFSREEIDDLFPFIREGITGPDGRIYAWWWGTDLRVLYYHKDHVTEPPQTWDELEAAAIDASENGVDGVLFNGGRWEGTTFDWLANFWSLGGELVDGSGKPIFGEGENRDRMLEALAYVKELVDSGAAPKRVATIQDYADFEAAAIGGTTAMFLGGHWQYRTLRDVMPAEAFGRWEVAELPGPQPDARATGTGGWTMAAFTEEPAKIEMCAALMREVYMGPANEVIGDLPTREELFETLPTFSDPYHSKLKEYLVNGRARPGVPVYPEISNQIQIMMGEILSGSKAPEEALDHAWRQVMDAYDKG